MREDAVASHVKLECARSGMLVQRNNVGVLMDARGVPVRYGLLNASPKENETWKSSDLVCVCPVMVTQAMVGRVLGVYTAIETKRTDWTLRTSDEHAQAQLRYHQLVRQHGGFAGFAQTPTDIHQIIGEGLR